MPQINLTSLLIPFGALLLGWVIGFLDSNLRTSKKIKEAEKKAELAIKEAHDKVADTESRLALFSATVPDDPGLLRLKKGEDDTIALELDGQSVDTMALSPEQRKRLIGLLSLMRPWLEGGSASKEVVHSPATPRTPPAPVVDARQGTPMVMPPLVPEVKPDVKKAPPPPLSIVEQIDSILQSRMMNTPLAQRDIRLRESHEGGVEVLVGMKKYSTVDDVPEEEIKAAIRAAIAEWEKKYTPGL
jgi:hypothetical protein